MQNESEISTAVADASIETRRAQAGKYLTFKLATEEYGLAILTVKEIIGLIGITKMPRTPDYIRGVINLRGKVIPVMDLRLKFEMELHEDTAETCIIVVDVVRSDSAVLMGILVDSVSEVLEIGSGEIEETPEFGSNLDTAFIQGMAKTSNSVIMLLDIDRVVSGKDLDLSIKVADSTEEETSGNIA